MQLIDGNGNFNVEGLKDFTTTTGFAHCGRSYAIVAIIGPQSSGLFFSVHTFYCLLTPCLCSCEVDYIVAYFFFAKLNLLGFDLVLF